MQLNYSRTYLLFIVLMKKIERIQQFVPRLVDPAKF